MGSGLSPRWSTLTAIWPAATLIGSCTPPAAGPSPHASNRFSNLAHPDCFAYLLTRLDALLTEYPISYIKWDHNRDLLDASDPRSGNAGVRESTLALYKLLAELKTRHPELEIESCASGGARVDLGILDYTDRIWTSDCIDPIERLDNQANTSLLVPYELMGAHIGGPRSHSTGRQHSLGFMARTAIFGHFGIEWNIADISDAQTHRAGRLGELPQGQPGPVPHRHQRSCRPRRTRPWICVALSPRDGGRAVFALTQRSASTTYPSGRITLPGLVRRRPLPRDPVPSA